MKNAILTLLLACSSFFATAQVSGSDSLCSGDSDTYTVPVVLGASYSWSVTGQVSASPTNTNSCTIVWGPAGTGTIVVTVNLPNATQIFHTLNVDIYPNPDPVITNVPYPGCPSGSEQTNPGGTDGGNGCKKVCKFATITYSTPLNPGSTYFWSVNGDVSFTGQSTNTVAVTWDATLTGSLTVYETNQWGCVDSATICVEKVDLPVAAFTHQASVCLNSPVTFQNLSTGATSYEWFFGDGGTSTTSAPTFTYTYSTPGTYTITLIAKNACHCTDTVTSTIVVSSLPGPDISCPSTVCADDIATYSTSAAGCIYNWFVTGGTIVGPNNLQTVTVNWGPGQIGTIGLVVTGCGGLCSDTTFVTIPIVPTTAVITGPAKVCPGSCETYYLPKFSGATYNWSLSGGCGTIQGDTACCEEVTICWPPNPFLNCNDTLTVNFWDALLGCGGSAQFIIKARPELSLFGPKLVCANSTSNYSTNIGIPVTWSISPAGPTLNPGPSPFTTVNWNGFTGNFTLTAVPVNPNAVCNDTVFLSVTSVAPPTIPVITGNTTVCANTTESYCATGGGTINWIITGGTPTSGTGNCINVTWGNTGPFIVSAYQQMPNSPFCNSDTATVVVNAISAPTVPTIPPVLAACANGNSTVFTSTVYPAGTTYNWTLSPANSGAIIGGQGSPSITIEWGNNAPQTVTVSLTVSVCGQTASNNVLVPLNPAPVVNITQLGTLCPGGSVQLQATGGVSYLWNTGFTGNPLIVTTPGNYSVIATNANGCSANKPFKVNQAIGPVASISSSSQLTYCIGAAINTTICALGNPGYTYLWSNGATTQCITVTTPGTFSVVVTDANGCSNPSNSITVSQIVCNGSGNPCSPDPASSVSFTKTNCNPVTFTNTSVGASNYSWNFGDGNSSGAISPTHSYAIAGFYLVTLSANVPNLTPPPAFCTLTSSQQVEVPLAANFNFAVACRYDPVCFTDLSTFTAGNNITSWSWNFGDLGTSTLQNPCHVYALPGTYTVTLTIGNGTCTHTISKTVVIPPQPTAAFSSSNPNCVNNPVAFTDASFASVNYWNWNFGNGGTSLNQNPNSSYTSSGTFPVTLIVRDIFGCYDTLVQNVVVNAPSVSGNIVAAPDTIVCAGTNVTLTAPTCVGCTYLWSTGSTLSSIVVTSTGIYTVTVTDPSGCTYSTFIKIIVHNAPSAQIQGPNKLCVGDFGTLSVNYNINWTYNWISNDPSVNGQTFSSVSVFGVTPGLYNYQVVITDTSTGCSDTTLMHLLTVCPTPVPPIITPFGPTTVCAGDSVILVGSHPDSTVTFLWSTGEITDTIAPTESGCYTLEVTDTNGCTSSTVYCITVNPMPYLCSFYEGCFDTCAPFTIPGPPGGITYQWLNNGVVIPGATSQNYTTSLSGLYSVIVTNSYGCTDTTGVLDLTLYPCDTLCANLIIDSVYCDPQGNYVVTYNVVNNLTTPINEVSFQALPPHLNLAYAPNLNFVNIPPGGTSPLLSATIYNGTAGDTICFRAHIVSNDSLGNEIICCYSDTVCFELPPCEEDTICCNFDYVSDSVWCVVDAATNLTQYYFSVEVDGCGYLDVSPLGFYTTVSWSNPTLIGGPTTITGVYAPPAGDPFNLCLTFVMGSSGYTPPYYCADETICLDAPPCAPDTACCLFDYVSDSVWCVVNSVGETEYHFNLVVDGCGSLDVSPLGFYTTVSWSNPTLISGPTTITGVYAPPAGDPFNLCLTFVMGSSGFVPPFYCADTTICLDAPPCAPDTACCLFDYVADSIWCVVNPVTNLTEYNFSIDVDGCGYLTATGGNNASLSWTNPTLISGPTTITGVYTPPAGGAFVNCVTLTMSSSIIVPQTFCADTTICFDEPPCPPDTSCCSFDFISDSSWCVVNQATGMTEYHFDVEIDGCGYLEVNSINNNTTLSWSNPTYINGPATISGVYTPPVGGAFSNCLTFVMSSNIQGQFVYCADTTICLAEPPCDHVIDSTCLISHTDSICVGQSVTFTYTGNSGATTYNWQFTNGTPNTATGIGPHTVTYNTPGCHPVILILNNTIPGTVDCVDEICVMPKPVATVTQFGNSLQANPSGMSYQWYSQNPTWTLMPGETNQFLNPSNTGLYSVIVTNQFGCSDTATTKFFPVGVEEIELENWGIFPNPNDGTFTVTFDSATNEKIELRLFNTIGALVDVRTLDVKPGSQEFFISNANLGTGVYFVMLASETGESGMRKLVVR